MTLTAALRDGLQGLTDKEMFVKKSKDQYFYDVRLIELNYQRIDTSNIADIECYFCDGFVLRMGEKQLFVKSQLFSPIFSAN
jgi:hypothetical protein